VLSYVGGNKESTINQVYFSKRACLSLMYVLSYWLCLYTQLCFEYISMFTVKFVLGIVYWMDVHISNHTCA